MRFFWNISLLHDCAEIIFCGLRVYLLTCRSWLHWFNSTLQFSWYRRIIDGKLMSNFYLYFCNQKCLFVQTQVSWYNWQLEHFSKLWSWHLSCIHHFLKVTHISEMYWVADITHVNFHGWPSNAILSFQIFIVYIQQHSDPTCGHQLPKSAVHFLCWFFCAGKI